MKKRAEYRHEVKTRLNDDVYDRLQRFKEINLIESDSEAIARLVQFAMFGFLPRFVSEAKD